MNNLKTKKWLNIPPYINPYPTKSYQLKKAQECGLNIPNTFVTNNKDSLNFFYKNNQENIITKNLSNPLFFEKNKNKFASYTSTVCIKDINTQNSIFFPSIFQANISKIVELRVFYLLGNFYTYAIFSSINEQTSIDFRIYDHEKPNRRMKYELTNELKFKIDKLMKVLNLHTGSIDLIKCNDSYVFLEVNPQGMFGGLENYGINIEEDLSNYLINSDEEA